jgi:aminoglycoside phosphotransferase (APT) family kinase protein
LSAQQQDDLDTYRLIITRRDGSELLCLPDGPYHSLPSVDIARWQRVAQPIRDALKTHLQLDAYSLFTCPSESPTSEASRTLFQAMECVHPNGLLPPTACWAPFSSLTITSFRDAEDSRRICNALRTLSYHDESLSEGPFAKPGWLREMCGWIARQIEPLKIRLTSNFQQLNASSSFSLMRFETSGPAVWFKAVGKPNTHEFNIVSILTTLFPTYLPPIIAVRPEWNAWLTTEVEGTSPNADSNFSTWMTISTRLAELQIASLHEVPRLISAGCRDIRVTSLLNFTDEFFAIMDKLIKNQVKAPPSILTSEELLDLKKQIKEILSALAASGMPDTLNHLDLNPGNIFVSGERCTFIDWAEAAIGHPFLTFQYLLEHVTRLRPDHADRREELVSAYASQWQCFAPPCAVSHALALAPLTAVFAYAISTSAWREPKVFANPSAAGYFRSLVRRMKREADALENRSRECTRV